MNKTELLQMGRRMLAPNDSGDIVEWLEANVHAIPDSPMPGHFRSERTPWIAAALRMAADPEVKLLIILASIQSGKSLFVRLFSCWVIANNPGPMMVLQAKDDEAKDFSIRYLRPVWNNCPPVKARFKGEDMDRSTTADFDRMTVYCRGIWNESNLQRLSLRYVIADECWLAPQGHLAEVSARVTAFGWMGKRFFVSQGGRKQQEFHQMFEQTNIYDWSCRCPDCDTLQAWDWNSVVFPKEARSAGNWNLEMVQEGTKYKCINCGSLWPDSPATRTDANARGGFVPRDPNRKNQGKVGLAWNSIATMSWGELAVMWLRAIAALDEFGDEEPLRIFIQKRLAQPYEEKTNEVMIEASIGEYKMGEDWHEEGGFIKGKSVMGKLVTPDMRAAPDFVRFRFMAVDVQKRGFYWIIRSWNGEGKSRMVACGYCFAWAELNDFQKKYQVHSANVFVDCGDQKDEVLQACGARGWNASRGDQRNEFSWKIRIPNGMVKTELRPYSAAQIETSGQKRVKVFYFSNLRLKDTLAAHIRKGRHTRPSDAPLEYIQQMQSEHRTISASGKPIWEQIADRANHFWDCEVIGMLPALAWRLTGRTEANEETTEEVKSED